jgi:hypothetical protein
VAGWETLQASPERLMYEAKKVKPKLQWRSQDVGDTRNKGCLLRKGIGN